MAYRGHQLMYQCEHQLADHLKKHKEHAKHTCKQLVNHKVKVLTIDGESIEGIVVNVDDHYVFLQVEDQRGFYPGGYGPGGGGHGHGHGYGPGPGWGPPGHGPNPNVILPLALFNLLTISLLW